MTIKKILFAILGSLGLVLLLALSIILFTSIARLQEATVAKQSNQITDLILSSAGTWAQERGLTNLELNAPLPASPASLARIRRLRAKADGDFRKALALMPKSGLKADPVQHIAFESAFVHLEASRAQVDQDLSLPLGQRDPALRRDWFPSISAVIERSQMFALHYTSQALIATSAISKDSIARHNLSLMSEYAGRERGLMAGIIASGRPITRDQMNALAEYRAYVVEGWRVFTNLEMRPDEKAVFGSPMARVRTGFFGTYETTRARLIREGMEGRPYSLTAQAWFDEATSAINDILALEKASTTYVDDRLELQTHAQVIVLWLCAAFLVLGIVAVGGAFWLVNRHVLYTVAKLDAIFENAGEGLMTIDSHGTITSFNPACERIFMTTAHEAVGSNVNAFMPEPFQSEHDSYLAHYAKTGEAKLIGEAGREFTGVRRGGESFPMALSVSQFELEDGTHFCGVIRDVTTTRMAEQDRQALLKKLIESNTELERFAYVASHDMQEPIRMVMNFSQVLVHDYGAQMDDKGREYLQVLSDSSHRMLTMISDLLQYARLGADGMTWSEVDMMEELKQVKLNLGELIAETAAVIDSVPLPKVYGNAIQLHRVLQNLISNAIKYKAQGRHPHIFIGVQDEGTHWLFSVTDNGMGIEEAYLQQIFEPFRRLHTQDQIKGAGFGLSIVKKIVESHGGEVLVTSTPGDGTTFSFTLPKRRPDTA
ncbi:Adaptive-response sensory-kinase SasA (plasmid) [Asticcacaulis sp. MM231]|uniref:ATP-binding protein n=1 Tax=Asticcacaulis sp. MM231 TaxID=3157666 RepID=UPI0032D59FDC